MNISDPEFWEEKYLLNETPWDTKTITPAIINAIDSSDNYKIGILGCGYSKDSILLAKKGHSVYAIDFALKPIKYLNEIKKKEKIDTLFPVKMDIFNLDKKYLVFFDIIIEYTCFCAIDPNRREEYVESVSKILNKKGKLVALFFPTERKEADLKKGPPFCVDLEETLLMFKNNFNIIKIDNNPESIKPRKGFESLVMMDKK